MFKGFIRGSLSVLVAVLLVVPARRVFASVAAAEEEIERVTAELERADEHTYPQDIPDPFHLTDQHLWVMRAGGNVSDRYHLAGSEGGLPRIVPQQDTIEAIVFAGCLGFRYHRAVHVIASIKPVAIAQDAELLVVIDVEGNVYAVDLFFARGELFKAPVPVHRLSFKTEYREGLQINFVTRGFSPFSYELTAQGEMRRIDFKRRFVAGDSVLWQPIAGQRVLVDVITRDFIITEINNGNFLLGHLAQALRSDKHVAIALAVAKEEK